MLPPCSLEYPYLQDLTEWYMNAYTSHKGVTPRQAVSIAAGLARTVMQEDITNPVNKRVSHVRGVLGETLAIAALGEFTQPDLPYRLIPSILPYEPLGIDIEVMNGEPYPIMGIGVKLARGQLPSVRRLPVFKKKIPVMHIKVDPVLVGIDELMQAQRDGNLLSPQQYIEQLFSSSEHANPFKSMLTAKCGEALDGGVKQSFPLAAAYLKQFV